MARQSDPVRAFKVGDVVSFVVMVPAGTYKNRRRGTIKRIKGKIALIACSDGLIPVFLRELKLHVTHPGATDASR